MLVEAQKKNMSTSVAVAGLLKSQLLFAAKDEVTAEWGGYHEIGFASCEGAEGCRNTPDGD